MHVYGRYRSIFSFKIKISEASDQCNLTSARNCIYIRVWPQVWERASCRKQNRIWLDTWYFWFDNGIQKDRLYCLVVRVTGYRSRGPGFDSRRYEGVHSTGLENRKYGSGDPLRWPRDILYPQKLALTSPTCGGRSVGIVRLRTKTTELMVFKGDLRGILRNTNMESMTSHMKSVAV
jgi:hypothetical protein